MQDYRLIYISEHDKAIDEEFLFSIMEASEKHNVELGITGLLLASDRHFIQVLEGSRANVNELYDIIVKDKRHNSIELVSYKPIAERAFPEWSMKIVSIDDSNKGLQEMILSHYGSSAGDFNFPQDPDMAFALLYEAYLYLTKG